MPKKLSAVTTRVTRYQAVRIDGVVKPTPPKSKLASTQLRPSTPSSHVCHIRFDQLPAQFVGALELVREASGKFRHVQRMADGIYESSYFNAELGRLIPLGRYIDEYTASFAHALARSDRKTRMTPFHAQDRIEQAFVSGYGLDDDDELNGDDLWASLLRPDPSELM